MRRTTGSFVAVLAGLGCAYALGWSGLPGPALAAVTQWAMDQGWVELSGPVGQVVRRALD